MTFCVLLLLALQYARFMCGLFECVECSIRHRLCLGVVVSIWPVHCIIRGAEWQLAPRAMLVVSGWNLLVKRSRLQSSVLVNEQTARVGLLIMYMPWPPLSYSATS